MKKLILFIIFQISIVLLFSQTYIGTQPPQYIPHPPTTNGTWTFYINNTSYTGSFSWYGPLQFTLTMGGITTTYNLSPEYANLFETKDLPDSKGGGKGQPTYPMDSESYGDEDDGGDDMGWGDGDNYGDDDGSGGDDSPWRPNQNQTVSVEDGNIEDFNQTQFLSSITQPCTTNKFLVFGNGIIEFTPAQLAKIKSFLFDGNNLTGFTDNAGNKFTYTYKVKTYDYGIGTTIQIGAYNPSYDFVCFDYLKNSSNFDAIALANPTFKKLDAYNPWTKQIETVFQNIPEDETYRYSFDSKATQCSIGDQINAIVSTEPKADPNVNKNKLYCYTLTATDCEIGMGSGRDNSFIPDEIQKHLHHHINVPDWLAKLSQKINHLITTPCSRSYVASKLDDLHKNDIYKNSSDFEQAKMEMEVVGYFSFFGSLNCATDIAQAKGKSAVIQYSYGLANELVNTLDVVSIIEGTCQIVKSASNTLTNQVKIVLDAVKEAVQEQTQSSGNFDFEKAAKKIVEKVSLETAIQFNSDYQKLTKIASHFQKMYFTECDKDITYGDICAYRYGQVTMMILPILITGGEYAIVKADALIANYLNKTKLASQLLVDAEKAAKVIDDIPALGNGAGDVATAVIKEADNKTVTTIYNDVTSVETKAAFLQATEADLAVLNNVTTNVLPSGGRSINSVTNLVNADKALILQPLNGSALQQTVLDYTKLLKAGSTATPAELGEYLEIVIEQCFKEINPNGITYRFGINQSGFDVISIVKDNSGNITKIYIAESKPLTMGVNSSSIKLEQPSYGTQLSIDWNTQTKNNMMNSTQTIIGSDGITTNISDLGNLINANFNKIEICVGTVDKKLKQPIIVKLQPFQN